MLLEGWCNIYESRKSGMTDIAIVPCSCRGHNYHPPSTMDLRKIANMEQNGSYVRVFLKEIALIERITSKRNVSNLSDCSNGVKHQGDLVLVQSRPSLLFSAGFPG